MEINLKLRSEILECSLHIEKEINNLILLLLGIYSDSKKTKLFGNKPGISFKNKIDLLYDIQILSKKENYDFELLMIFRNKFLHDIDCDSFHAVFEQISDNGIINKFKDFLDEDKNINDETACLFAFKLLFLKNLKVIHDKVKSRKQLIENKAKLLQVLIDQNTFQVDLFFNLISEIYSACENADLVDNKVQELVKTVTTICKENADKYSSDEKFISLQKEHNELLLNNDFQKFYWNIMKSDTIESK